MKTLLWKELRQLLLPSLLLLVLVTGLITAILYNDFEHRPYQFPTEGLPATLIFCAGCVAAVLGFLQTVLEIRRDQWAFLIHRSTPTPQIFRAKAVAAGIMYTAILAVPLLVALFWIRRGGIEHYPFSWYQTLPALGVVIASFGFYFAAVAAVVWKGPWYVSRLFPLFAACIPVFIVFCAYSGFTEYVPATVFLVATIVVGIIGIASRGIFVKSGEAAGRSRWATICLGFVSYLATQVALICVVYAVGGLMSFLLEEPTPSGQVYDSYFINRAGHICRVVGSAGYSYNRMIDSITDLEDPTSKKYDSLIGKSLQEVMSPQSFLKYPAWDELPGSSFIHPQGQGQPKRTILNHILTTGTRNANGELLKLAPPNASQKVEGRRYLGDRVEWINSTSTGWIYGYAEEFEDRNGRSIRLPPRLAALIGPEEVTDGTSRPQSHFSKIQVVPRAYRFNAKRQFEYDPTLPTTFYLLSDSGLFEVDSFARRIRRLISSPPGETARAFSMLDDGFGIAYDRSIEIYLVPNKPAAKENELTYYDLSRGQLQGTFAIPERVQQAEYFIYSWLPGQNQIIYKLRYADVTDFLYARADGTIAREQNIDNTRITVDSSMFPIMSVCASLLPAGPIALFVGGDAIVQGASDRGFGILKTVWKESAVGTIVVLAVLFASPLVCCWFASRTVRKYGLDSRTRTVWYAMSLFFGPAGLLTMWFLRDWPAKVACQTCNKPRPVDREACPHCGKPFSPPERNGTEVFGLAQQAVTQPV